MTHEFIKSRHIVEHLSEVGNKPEGETVSMVIGVFALRREMYREVQFLYYHLENDTNLTWGYLNVLRNR